MEKGSTHEAETIYRNYYNEADEEMMMGRNHGGSLTVCPVSSNVVYFRTIPSGRLELVAFPREAVNAARFVSFQGLGRSGQAWRAWLVDERLTVWRA